MRRGRRTGATIVITLLLLASTLSWRPAAARPSPRPPLPAQQPLTGNCYYDNIYYGAIPPGGAESPVLVFVHGLSGMAKDWWQDTATAGPNDFYDRAYAAGYRTAFVNLNIYPFDGGSCRPERRPAKTPFANGYTLRQQLDRIAERYHVRQVDVIAHSKGAVDAQAAVVWWNAAPLVRRIFGLGPPHHGSPLADLLWSPEGAWVGALLGQLDDSTFSMRTAWMQSFRAATDGEAIDDAIEYYTAAGNFWNTADSLYASTGAWLQAQPEGGDNDGIVVVSSTRLLDASQIYLKPLNHTLVSVGRNSWPEIAAVLRRAPAPGSRLYLPLLAGPAAGSAGATAAASGAILRGGRVGSVERVAIEPGARSAHFTLIASDPRVRAELVDPAGAARELAARASVAEDMLAGACYGRALVAAPEPGWWRLRVDGPPGAAYLLLLTLDSPLQVRLAGLDAAALRPHEPLRLHASVAGAPATITEMSARLGAPAADALAGPDLHAAGPALALELAAPGVYSLSVRVSGQLAGGQPFERSFVRSVAGSTAASSSLGLLNMPRR